MLPLKRIALDDFALRGIAEVWRSEPPASVLEVACNETFLADELCELGYDPVVGVDFRPCDRAERRFSFLQSDFLSIENLQQAPFDIAVAVSAIEHFGLGFYEDPLDDLGDVKASQKIYDFLKPGGLFYVSVPTGTFKQTNHWRRYTCELLLERIIQNFEVLKMQAFRPGKEPSWLSEVSEEEAFSDPPDRGCPWEMVLVLRKPSL